MSNFNFLGLLFNEHMFWKPHIDIIANKLMKFSGILYKLKKFLPSHILRTLYFSMVQSRFTYGILAWGFECQRFVKLQKRFIRIISLSTYNAHTESLFKNLEILTIKNLFDLNCLKFVYNYKKGEICHVYCVCCFWKINVSWFLIPDSCQDVLHRLPCPVIARISSDSTASDYTKLIIYIRLKIYFRLKTRK